MIIIPDIHGRTFWKEAVLGKETEDIIFLGDYLDPYSNEGISKEGAINNFIEIIEFKKSHLDNVTLLLGNHDFMMYISNSMGNCRTDFTNLEKISSLFKSNLELFKVAHIVKLNDIKYIFSHAPLKKDWVTFCNNYWELNNPIPENVIDLLNDSLFNNLNILCSHLNVVSRYRGGFGMYGSIVWADVCEMSESEPEYEGYYEIFGHTQLRNNPIIEKHFACLDCRKAFKLENNIISEL